MTESDQENGAVVVESKVEGGEEEVLEKEVLNNDNDSIDDLLGDNDDNDTEHRAEQAEGHNNEEEYEEEEYEEEEDVEGDDEYEDEEGDEYEDEEGDDEYEEDEETDYEDYDDYDSMVRTTSFDAITERLYADAADRERRRAELVHYYEIQQEEEMTFSPRLVTKASSRPSTQGMEGNVHDSLYNRAKAKRRRDLERRKLAEQPPKESGSRSRKESERIAQEMYDKSMKRMEEIHRRRAQAAKEMRPSFTPELATKGRRSMTPPSTAARRNNGGKNGSAAASTSPSREASERLYTTAQALQLRKEERKRRAAQASQNFPYAPDVNGRKSAMAYAPQHGEAHPDPRSLPVWDKLYEISKNQHKKVYSPPPKNGAGSTTRPRSTQRQTPPSSGNSRWEQLYQAGVEKERHKKHLDNLSDVLPAAPKTSPEGLLATRPTPSVSPKPPTAAAAPAAGARATSRIPRFSETNKTQPQPPGILKNKPASPRTPPASKRPSPSTPRKSDDLEDVLGNDTTMEEPPIGETDDEEDIAEMLEAAKPPSNLTAAEVGPVSVASSTQSSVPVSEVAAATTNSRKMSDKGRTSSSSLSSPSSGGMFKRLISRSSSIESPLSPPKSHKRVVVEARMALANSPPQSPASPNNKKKAVTKTPRSPVSPNGKKKAVTKTPQPSKRGSSSKPPAAPSSAPGDWRSMGAAFARAAANVSADQTKPAAPEDATAPTAAGAPATAASSEEAAPAPPKLPESSPEVAAPKQIIPSTPEEGAVTPPPSRPSPPVKSSSHMSLSSQEATPRAKNGKGGGFVVWKSSVSAAISRSKQQKTSRRSNRGRGRGPVDVDDIPKDDDDMMAQLAMPSTDRLGEDLDEDTLGELPTSSSPRVVVGLQHVLTDSHRRKEARMAMTDDEQDAASATSSVRSTTRDGSMPSKTKKKRRGFGRVKFW